MHRMHHWAYRTFCGFVICWSFAATAHKNPPVEIQPIPIPIIDPEEICNTNLKSPAVPAPIYVPEQKQKLAIEDVVRAKISERVNGLNSPNGYLWSDEKLDNATDLTPINEGITRLFLREVVERMRRDVMNSLKKYGTEWNKERRRVIDREQTESGDTRVREKDKPLIYLNPEADGYFITSFTTKYRADMEAMVAKMDEKEKEEFFSRPVSKEEAKAGKKGGGIRVHETKLREYLLKEASSNLSTSQKGLLMYNYEAAVNALVANVVDGPNGIRARYLRAETRDPDFPVLEQALQNLMNQFVAEVSQRFPIDKPINMTLAAPKARDYVQQDEQGRVYAKFGEDIARYQPEIASLVLTSPQGNKPSTRIINLAEFHGSGSNWSNVASWKTLFAKAIQAGYDPIAFDLPGSVGTNGIGLNSIRTPVEMNEYLRQLFQFVAQNASNPNLPMVMMGRSMGATIGGMNMFYAPMTGKEPLADLIFMMSYSNPKTIELQVENLLLQLREGQIDGIVKSALDHAIVMTRQFQNDLRKVNAKELSLLEKRTQDRGVFAQGGADEDGVLPGSKPGAIITELTEDRDSYFPFAHVYPFEAPQLAEKYIQKWWENYRIPPDASEGTHFLLSSVANMTDKNRGIIPMEVPEKDLPKLEDQQFEVYALMYAMLDYQIDFSPLTEIGRRTSLQGKRFVATGSHSPFAYLNWFLNNVVNVRQAQKMQRGEMPSEEILSLGQIINSPNILVGRDSGVYGRIKRVYEFVLSERARIEALLQ